MYVFAARLKVRENVDSSIHAPALSLYRVPILEIKKKEQKRVTRDT